MKIHPESALFGAALLALVLMAGNAAVGDIVRASNMSWTFLPSSQCWVLAWLRESSSPSLR